MPQSGKAGQQERGMNVEFVWWGASELIERLSRPEHIGRLFFWFDERYFDEAWYADRLQEAINAAGTSLHAGSACRFSNRARFRDVWKDKCRHQSHQGDGA